MKRIWMLFAAVLCTCALQAQDLATNPNPMSADLRGRYDYIKKYLVAAAEKMPEEAYAFQPTKEIKSFGLVIAHTADVQMAFCSMAAGARKNLNAAALKTKAEWVAALKASFDECDPLYAGLTDAAAAEMVPAITGKAPRLTTLFYNVTHDNEMYGVIGVYLRLKGVVPPSTVDAEAAQAKRQKANTQP